MVTATDTFFSLGHPRHGALLELVFSALETPGGGVGDLFPLLGVSKHLRKTVSYYLASKFLTTKVPPNVNLVQNKPIKGTGHYLEVYPAEWYGCEPANADPRYYYAKKPKQGLMDGMEVRYMVMEDFDPVTMMCTFTRTIKCQLALPPGEDDDFENIMSQDMCGIPFDIMTDEKGEPWADVSYRAFSVNSSAWFGEKTVAHKEEDNIKKKACPRRRGDWHLNEEYLPVVFSVYPLLDIPEKHSVVTYPALVSKTPGILPNNYMLKAKEKCWGRGELEFYMFNLDFVYQEPPRKDSMGFEANGGFFPVKATWHLLHLFRPPIEVDEDGEYVKSHF